MRKLILMISLIGQLASCLMAQPKPSILLEREAILNVAQYYAEGCYEGKADRLNQVLHPEIVKRGLIPLPGTGKLVLDLVNRQGLMDSARAGISQSPKGRTKFQIRVLDISGNMASAKVISGKFVDYLQLGKLNGEWRIINILTEIISPGTISH
jgi:hypothetical protein